MTVQRSISRSRNGGGTVLVAYARDHDQAKRSERRTSRAQSLRMAWVSIIMTARSAMLAPKRRIVSNRPRRAREAINRSASSCAHVSMMIACWNGAYTGGDVHSVSPGSLRARIRKVDHIRAVSRDSRPLASAVSDLYVVSAR